MTLCFYIELKNAVSKMEILEKEYHKAQRVLDKSRKAKDVEMLFTENDSLQNKLIAQEEQFREQNQTLMQELAKVYNYFKLLDSKINCHQLSISLLLLMKNWKLQQKIVTLDVKLNSHLIRNVNVIYQLKLLKSS